MISPTYWTTSLWMRLPNLFSIRELKLKYLSHKRTLWIEDPELKFRKKAYIKRTYWIKSVWIRLLEVSFPSVSWKKNISHTKGHYGWKNLKQISRRKQSGRSQKEKSPKASEEWKRHGNEEQMNISVHTLLQSYGVKVGRHPKVEVK